MKKFKTLGIKLYKEALSEMATLTTEKPIQFSGDAQVAYAIIKREEGKTLKVENKLKLARILMSL